MADTNKDKSSLESLEIILENLKRVNKNLKKAVKEHDKRKPKN